MMKIAGFGLLGLAALMVIPSGVSAGAAPMMYGIADIEIRDADGNVRMAQTVHNQLTDEGEEFLIDQVFDTGDTAQTGNDRVHEICVLNDSYTAYSEDTTSADGAAGSHLEVTNSLAGVCKGAVTDNGSSAQIGPVTFTTGPDFRITTLAGNTQTAGGFLVCAVTNGSNCNGGTSSGQVALAAVDINDVALPNRNDALTITYTFDISTPNA